MQEERSSRISNFFLMVRPVDGLFAVLRAAPPGAELSAKRRLRLVVAVVRALEYEFSKFGPARICIVDPHEVWRVRDPETFARIAAMEGRSFPSLGAACQTLYRAFHPQGKRTVYMRTFECYVVGLPKEGEPEYSLLGNRTERTGYFGERIESHFSPGLANRPVRILPNEDSISDGEWVPLGMLRPFVPPQMTDDEVKLALDATERKGGYEPRRPPGQRKAPREDGASTSAGVAGALDVGDRRKKLCKKDFLKVGMVVLIADGYSQGEASSDHPYVIESFEYARSASSSNRSNGRMQGERHAALRSLVDDSVRCLPRSALTSLGAGFRKRAERHLCACADHPVCVGMLRAVDVQRSRAPYPRPREAQLRELAPSVVHTLGDWCEGGT